MWIVKDRIKLKKYAILRRRGERAMCLPLSIHREVNVYYIPLFCLSLSLCFFLNSSILMATLSLSLSLSLCTFVFFLRPNPSDRMTEKSTRFDLSHISTAIFFSLVTLFFFLSYVFIPQLKLMSERKKKVTWLQSGASTSHSDVIKGSLLNNIIWSLPCNGSIVILWVTRTPGFNNRLH